MYNDITDFIYHASTNGQERRTLDAHHCLPFGDWGDGAYLSDSYELSKIWGASGEYSDYRAAINIYDIDDHIRQLNGLVINPNDNDQLLIWAASIAMCRTERIRRWLEKDGTSEEFINYTINSIIEAYRIYEVSEIIDDCDWIISRRSDDGLWSFIVEFFSDNLSIDGLREVYDVCSFGDQLVLKTTRATQCLNFVECEKYDTSSYIGNYDSITASNRNKFFDIFKTHSGQLMQGTELLCRNTVWNYNEQSRINDDRLY